MPRTGNACDADYDGNGVVGASEFIRLRAAFGEQSGDSGFDPDLDVDGDGAIGDREFLLLRGSFGHVPGPLGLSCAGTVP